MKFEIESCPERIYMARRRTTSMENGAFSKVLGPAFQSVAALLSERQVEPVGRCTDGFQVAGLFRLSQLALSAKQKLPRLFSCQVDILRLDSVGIADFFRHIKVDAAAVLVG